jgi:uncharacterized protein YfeS
MFIYLTTIYQPQMLSSAESYVRYIALGEIKIMSEVKGKCRDLFQFALSSEQKDKNLSRVRDLTKYETNNTDRRQTCYFVRQHTLQCHDSQ